jgi:hypothetical protein
MRILVFITTIINVISLKMHIFENVLLSTRWPHGRRIMNLFRKLILSCICSNSTSFPTPHPWNKARVKPPSVQTSSTHASYAQQFLSVNVSNRAAQCQILWPATACKQQRDSHASFKSHSNTNPLNQYVGKQSKKNYRKITEISASLSFLTLPMQQR